MDIDSVVVRYVSTNLKGEEVPENGDEGPELDVYSRITNNSNHEISLDVLKHHICMEFVIAGEFYNSCQVSIIPDPNNQDSNYVLNPGESVQLITYHNPILIAGLNRETSHDYSALLMELLGTFNLTYSDGSHQLSSSHIGLLLVK